MEKRQLNIVMAGHVDHGKSTLIGRLIYAMDALPDGKYEQIVASCERRGVQFEWAYLMDALQTERAQNITIDISQFWLRTLDADYVLIDAPGHHEFLRNMFTGAAEADCAILIVDACAGMEEQTRKHAYLLHLLGIKQLIIVINKMDKVGYAQEKFMELSEEIEHYLHEIGFSPAHIVPISAYYGENLRTTSKQMPWYDGLTLIQAMQQLATARPTHQQPLRFAVQDVYRFDARRIIAGTVLSGEIKVGDELLISPHNYQAKVATIITPQNENAQSALAGEAIGITLEQQRFVQRGHIISHNEDAPILSNKFYMRIFWLGTKPLAIGDDYKLRLHNSTLNAQIEQIEYVINTNDLSKTEAELVQQHQVASILLHVRGLAVLDEYEKIASMGRAVLMHDGRIVAAGLASMNGLVNMRSAPKVVTSKNVTLENMEILPTQRRILNGHDAGILWFTGLSGSGKSTLAKELQKQLFTRGYQVYVLDGDNIRQGLNSDLGFSPSDRTENIRRIGEVAALFADAGMIVITAFISPYCEDRLKARSAAPELFHTVYIKAGIEECEKRDAKGLYQKARLGQIGDFTGISAPYELPENPELVIDTETMSIEESVEKLLHYVENNFGGLYSSS